jgi:hypothetical protein
MAGYAYNNTVIGSTIFTSTQCWYNIITPIKTGFGINMLMAQGNLSVTGTRAK